MADRGTRSAGIVEAATGVFLRYGFSRTTMGDIAGAAGISRPALYLVFPSKDDVFAAVVRHIDAKWHAELTLGLDDQPSAEARIRHACGQWATHGIDMVATYPDAKDLFDLRFGAVREMYEHFEQVLAGLIDEGLAGSRLRATARELARSLIYALRGIKDAATSVTEMRRLADLQVAVLVAALDLRRDLPRPSPGSGRRVRRTRRERAARGPAGRRAGRGGEPPPKPAG